MTEIEIVSHLLQRAWHAIPVPYAEAQILSDALEDCGRAAEAQVLRCGGNLALLSFESQGWHITLTSYGQPLRDCDYLLVLDSEGDG